jgi:membrane-bound lytic murein transglycosylase MltF
VEKMRRQQDAIMKKFREAEKKVEEAGKDAKTVYETEMEMIRNFHMRSESPLPLID